MFWYDGVQPSPASTKKKIAGSAMDWSPFVFSETDPGGLFTIVLFSYFVGVKHTKVTKQAFVQSGNKTSFYITLCVISIFCLALF